MPDAHQNAIMDVLRIPSNAHAPVIETRWTSFSRARTFFSPLPTGTLPSWKVHRPGIWDSGWKPRAPVLPTISKSRGEENGIPMAATYQYAPNHLLYVASWNNVQTVGQIASLIRDAMPDSVKPSWDVLANSLTQDVHDERAVPAVRWLVTHSDQIGARAPNLRERGKAFGMWQYLKDLGLDDRQLFDAQGDMTDKDALVSRIGHAVVGWLQGQIHLSNVGTAGPAEVQCVWTQLAKHLSADGLDAPTPGPLQQVDAASLTLAVDRIMGPRSKVPKTGPTQVDDSARVVHRVAQSNHPCIDEEGKENRYVDLHGGDQSLGRPFRGHAGSGSPHLINVCVIDSIMQLLYGAPRAAESNEARENVRTEAHRVRSTLQLGPCKTNHDQSPDGLISAGEAWLIITAREYQGVRPGPILIEMPCDPENRNRADAHARRAFASHGPWNGRIVAVVTGGGHTEPIFWEQDGAVVPRLAGGRHALPKAITVPGDLGVTGLYATYLKLRLRWWSRVRESRPNDMNQLVLATTVRVGWEKDRCGANLPDLAIQTIDFRRQAGDGTFEHDAVAGILLQGDYQQQAEQPGQFETPIEIATFGNHKPGNTMMVLLHDREVAVAEAESHDALQKILAYAKGSIRSRGGA